MFHSSQPKNYLSYRPLVGLNGFGIENTFIMGCFLNFIKLYINLGGALNNRKYHISVVFEGVLTLEACSCDTI